MLAPVPLFPGRNPARRSADLVRRSDFSDVAEVPEAFTDNQLRDAHNELVRRLAPKAVLSALALVLALPLFGGLVVETAVKGELSNRSNVVTSVSWEGGTGIDTNSVRGVVDSSFRGGTQEVNRVTGAFDGVARYTGTLNVRKRNRFDVSSGWTWSSSDPDCPQAVVEALNGAMNFPYPDVIEGTANLSWGVGDVFTNGAFAARCVGPLTYPASADVREMTFRFSTNPVATAGFDFEATARAADSLALRSHVDSATNGLRKVTGDTRFLPRYAHFETMDDSYWEEAKAYYARFDDTNTRVRAEGGCSAVRFGNTLGRNFDWNYDETPEWVVKVAASGARHGSVCVSAFSSGGGPTEDEVNSGAWTNVYKLLPGVAVDGINDAGVVVEVNVIPTNSVDPVKDVDGRDLSAKGVVRWVLDNASNASDAAAYVAAHYYIPAALRAKGYSYHWMIADATSTWIVEDGQAHDGTHAGLPTPMTNYPLYREDDCATGWTRYALMDDLGASIDIGAVLPQLRFSDAYATNSLGAFPRPDEFAGSVDAQGPIPYYAEARLQAWAEANVAPRLPPKRGAGYWWQTMHSSIYDISNRTVSVCFQEDFGNRYVFRCPSPFAADVPERDPVFSAWADSSTNESGTVTNALPGYVELGDFRMAADGRTFVRTVVPGEYVVEILTNGYNKLNDPAYAGVMTEIPPRLSYLDRSFRIDVLSYPNYFALDYDTRTTASDRWTLLANGTYGVGRFPQGSGPVYGDVGTYVMPAASLSQGPTTLRFRYTDPVVRWVGTNVYDRVVSGSAEWEPFSNAVMRVFGR